VLQVPSWESNGTASNKKIRKPTVARTVTSKKSETPKLHRKQNEIQRLLSAVEALIMKDR